MTGTGPENIHQKRIPSAHFIFLITITNLVCDAHCIGCRCFILLPIFLHEAFHLEMFHQACSHKLSLHPSFWKSELDSPQEGCHFSVVFAVENPQTGFLNNQKKKRHQSHPSVFEALQVASISSSRSWIFFCSQVPDSAKSKLAASVESNGLGGPPSRCWR